MRVNGHTNVVMEEHRTSGQVKFDQSSAFDIPGMIDSLKHEQAWLAGEPGSVILLKSPVLRVLLTVLHEGTEVVSFQSDDSITFQVIEGSMEIHVNGKSMVLGTGELLTLDEKTRYSFDILEDTAFLLTLVSDKEDKSD